MPAYSRAKIRLQRSLAIPLFFVLLGCAFGQDAYVQDVQHFAYTKSAPLDIKEISLEKRGSVTVHDITYAGANGTVPAYLVVPNGTGPFAAVLWGHWMLPHSPTANRKEFLDEAMAIAPAGVVSLLIDAPQVRPGYKQQHKALFQAPAELLQQQVIDLRRGIDLLLSRNDVDPKRIAYVGHSFDSSAGVTLDAVDKRPAAFVFMGGPISMRQYALTSEDPSVIAFRKAIPADTVTTALDTYAWSDPGTYAMHLGPSPALFQYALHDHYSPEAFAKQFFAMVSGPKEMKFYDSDHALNAEARRDRFKFLQAHLALANLAPGILDSVPPTQ